MGVLRKGDVSRRLEICAGLRSLVLGGPEAKSVEGAMGSGVRVVLVGLLHAKRGPIHLQRRPRPI